MGHSHTNIRFHLIFSTKKRQKLLREDLQPELWAYMAGVARNCGFRAVKIGGIEDHVHLLIETPAVLPPAKAAQVIKANSSRWMKRHVRLFEWQKGYAAFSVSASLVNKTIVDIANQKQHHEKFSFEEELMEFLRKNGVEYDEKELFG